LCIPQAASTLRPEALGKLAAGGGRGGGEGESWEGGRGRQRVHLAPAGGVQSPCAFTGRQGLDYILHGWLPSVQGTACPAIVKLGPQQQLPGAQQGGHQPPAGGNHSLQHPLSTVHFPQEATAEAENTQQQRFCHKLESTILGQDSMLSLPFQVRTAC